MSTPLLISGRIPREMKRLAKEHYTYADRAEVVRYWYRLYDGRETPQWLLVRVTAYAGRPELSIVCMVCSDGDGGYYLTPYVGGVRKIEEKVLSDWRRITKECWQEE